MVVTLFFGHNTHTHNQLERTGTHVNEFARKETHRHTNTPNEQDIQTEMTSLITQANIPDVLVCPITKELMKDPVITNGGQTYERKAIEEWMRRQKLILLQEIQLHVLFRILLLKICVKNTEIRANKTCPLLNQTCLPPTCRPR